MVSVMVASSLLPTPQKLKTPFRVARPYHLVQCVSGSPPSVGSCRETNLCTSTMTMVLLANHHRVGRDTSYSAVATAQDPRPVPCHGRQLALWLVPVEWRASTAPRALASTTARTSARCCHRRQWQRCVVSSPVPARLRPRKPDQWPNPIHNQCPFLLPPSPHQRLPRHLNNQQR